MSKVENKKRVHLQQLMDKIPHFPWMIAEVTTENESSDLIVRIWGLKSILQKLRNEPHD